MVARAAGQRPRALPARPRDVTTATSLACRGLSDSDTPTNTYVVHRTCNYLLTINNHAIKFQLYFLIHEKICRDLIYARYLTFNHS